MSHWYVSPGKVPLAGDLQRAARTQPPFFCLRHPRHARVLGCTFGLLVGALGHLAAVGDLGSCPWPVVSLPYSN
jgi:hypothetical protein